MPYMALQSFFNREKNIKKKVLRELRKNKKNIGELIPMYIFLNELDGFRFERKSIEEDIKEKCEKLYLENKNKYFDLLKGLNKAKARSLNGLYMQGESYTRSVEDLIIIFENIYW